MAVCVGQGSSAVRGSRPRSISTTRGPVSTRTFLGFASSRAAIASMGREAASTGVSGSPSVVSTGSTDVGVPAVPRDDTVGASRLTCPP